jgi:hypothetical protein
MTIEQARANVRRQLTYWEESYRRVKPKFDKEARAEMEGYLAGLRDVLHYMLEEYEGPGK